jgi:hypothetical protein
MALFSECMQRCGKKALDKASVVRQAMSRQQGSMRDSSNKYYHMTANTNVLIKTDAPALAAWRADGQELWVDRRHRLDLD